MQEENKNIKLELGNVSFDRILGSYYIDMRPAMIHYSEGIYGGDFDELGVPRINDGGELIYSPVNLCQYGFMVHAEYLETKNEALLQTLKAILDRLIALQVEKEDTIAWYSYTFDFKYKINPPWASGMTQGEAISFYLRMYQLNGDEKLLVFANKAYKFLNVDVKDGGVMTRDTKDFLWYEEFPSTPSSYVLNGFIYAIFGLYDLYRVCPNEDLKSKIEECNATVKYYLPEFDANYWSYYDLLKKELVRYYYQKNVHVPQLRVLARLTGDSFFENYASKWQMQLTPWNYMLVKIMYRVLPRWRKKTIRLG